MIHSNEKSKTKKVLHEKSLSKRDEDNFRYKIKTIKNKINKESDKIDSKSCRRSINEYSSSTDRIKLNV